MYESFGIEPKPLHMVYKKLYPEYFYKVPYPHGYKVPEFVNGVDNKTTWDT